MAQQVAHANASGGLGDNELPSLFGLADHAATWSKRWHFFLVGGELVCISLAAVAKVFEPQIAPVLARLLPIRVTLTVPLRGNQVSGSDLTNLVATYALPTLLLAIAAAMYVWRLVKRFDSMWRARRALAEAARELAWRYSMRAMPEDLRASGPLSDEDSKSAFGKEFQTLKQQGNGLQLGAPKGLEITDAMTALRNSETSRQRDSYLQGRMVPAQDWYTRRTDRYHFWTWFFQVARILAYVAGGVLIFLSVFGSNGFGAMTTIAGAFGTWLVAKHFDDLSQSYSGIANDLNILRQTAPSAGAPGSAAWVVEAVASESLGAGGETVVAVATIESISAAGGTPTKVWPQFVDKIETILKGERQDWLRTTRVGRAAEGE